MKRLMLLVLVVAALGANSVMTTGVAVNAHPQPSYGWEFYWDDGIMSSGWVWYTGGNYWAVQFDEVKTGGVTNGWVFAYGAVTYPDWPDGAFQGCNLHTFSDLGGYPGSDLGYENLVATVGGVFDWVDADPIVNLTDAVFYIAWQQVGNYPSCDSVGVDAVAGTHDWTGYQGSWGPSTAFGDFMVRCYWEYRMDVEESSWGAVKALY
jgi:hypothetical protein